MNIYPVWWDTTITIYNKFTDPQTRVISWYKHTVSNCFWKYTGEKITVGETVLSTNDTICRIPKTVSKDSAIVGYAVVGDAIVNVSGAYMDKYLWEQLPNNEMNNYFTLGVGDIIVKGKVSDIMDEYAAGHRSSDIIAKYKKLQGCIVIETFSDNTGIGRGSEHYLVKGV